jgi:hypothetical protein
LNLLHLLNFLDLLNQLRLLHSFDFLDLLN